MRTVGAGNRKLGGGKWDTELLGALEATVCLYLIRL